MPGAGEGEGAEERQIGRLVAGRYRVNQVLGRGGMGTVCRAMDEVLGREVALKELRAFNDASGGELADLRLRMQREARAAARIRHAGVIAVYDVAEEEGRPVIVMELVDGPSLDDVLRERGALDPREAAAIGAKVADALGAAHECGVLHRDVKPGNVLLERGGRVILTDFGIAMMDDPGDGTTSNLTGSGQLVGSLDFIAPERAQGQQPGPASDMWSLGAMLYAAVEGGSPFRRTSAWSTLSAIVTEPLPEPVKAGALGPVLRELMRKDAAARPDARRARQLLEAVAQAPAGPDGTAAAPAASAATGGAGSPKTTDLGRRDVPAQPGAPSAPGQAAPPFAPSAAAPASTAPASAERDTWPGPGWRPPGSIADTQPQPPSADGTDGGRRRSLTIAAAVGAVLLVGGGVTWAVVGGSGGSAPTRQLAQPGSSVVGGLPFGSASPTGTASPDGSPSPSGSGPASKDGSAPPAAKGGTQTSAAGGTSSSSNGGNGGSGGGGGATGPATTGGGATPTPGASSTPSPTPVPPTGDPGYIPGSLASTDGCMAWLDYKVESGKGGFAKGTVETAGNSCEMHFFRGYPSKPSSTQNLNSFHTISSGRQSTDWYWDGEGYYAGVCVWKVGHYSAYSCGGRYYVTTSGQLKSA